MRALTLQQVNVAQSEQQQQQSATRGRSLTSNYAPLNLENKFLDRTSTALPQTSLLTKPSALGPSFCSSFHPSSLSSTSSSLLSTSSICSPLLSTQNKLLTSQSPHLSFSLTSSVLHDSALSSSLLLRPPSFLPHGLGGGQKPDDGGDEGRRRTEGMSEVMPCSFETTSVCSEEAHAPPEDTEEDELDSPTAMELPVTETEPTSTDPNPPVSFTQEEFPEFIQENQNVNEDLESKKYFLLNEVCCSLVNKTTAPGQKEWNTEDSVWTKIQNLAKDISVHEPEFLLKVALYARQELNIRITANFLLALAASQDATKPHVRRYFCAAVQLPSDWLEVVRIYSTCFSRSLPSCLKKAMADKFKEFSEYQLAKYNTRKHRCKHKSKKEKKKPTSEELKNWASVLGTQESTLLKFLQTDGATKVQVVDKKQSEFSLKKMIKRLHIKEPPEQVMAILGKKYPADVKAFTHSGMKGVWDRERAGQRMKLQQPETWERLLSLQGNKAATWERLIDNHSLPFMAMLRNLRNMISQGISEAHHKKILSKLTNKKAVIQSRQFPFRFLAAYKVIMELQELASKSLHKVPTVKEILTEILKKIPRSKRGKSMEWENMHRRRLKTTLGVPFIYQRYKTKKAQLIKANQRHFTLELLQRYRKALEQAVEISCRYNIPPLPGRTFILLSTDLLNYGKEWLKTDFCLPPEPDEKVQGEGENEGTEEDEEEQEEEAPKKKKKSDEDDKLTPSIMEVGALLSLMIRTSAEDTQLCLFNREAAEDVDLKSDDMLENVRSVVEQAKKMNEMGYDKLDISKISKVLSHNSKFDNIVILEGCLFSNLQYLINKYRKEVNNKALLVNIMMTGRVYGEFGVGCNDVTLTGFSEQMLR